MPANAAYWWLGHLISGFRIETIAFVGGYVFCYQCVELGRQQGFLAFVWKKFKRLIIPCFIFGTVYFLLYRFNPARFSWNVAFWRVANGIGHLWFLPMLFWCFLACWLLDRLLSLVNRRNPRGEKWLAIALLLILAAVSLLRLKGLKMGLTRAPYFLFYFYLGYWIRRSRLTLRWPGMLWLLYLLFLLLHLQATHLYMPGCSFKCPHWLQGCPQVLLRLFNLGHTLCGILALYGTVMHWLRRHRDSEAQPKPFLQACSTMCYGVYVLHMFFMQHIYYYTPFPAWCCGSAVGMWLMPWIVLAVTLALSILTTWLLLKTRFGRFLIG